jgi:hypothetical protein
MTMAVEGVADVALYPNHTKLTLTCDGRHRGERPSQTFVHSCGYTEAWMMAAAAGWRDVIADNRRRFYCPQCLGEIES